VDVTPSPAAYTTNGIAGSDTPAWTMRPALPMKSINIFIKIIMMKFFFTILIYINIINFLLNK